jgi:hypothetical protein
MLATRSIARAMSMTGKSARLIAGRVTNQLGYAVTRQLSTENSSIDRKCQYLAKTNKTLTCDMMISGYCPDR